MGKKNRDTRHGQVNINEARQDELEAIAGVGEATAEKIVLYRKEHGDFDSVDELRDVEGIDKARFDALKDHFKV